LDELRLVVLLLARLAPSAWIMRSERTADSCCLPYTAPRLYSLVSERWDGLVLAREGRRCVMPPSTFWLLVLWLPNVLDCRRWFERRLKRGRAARRRCLLLQPPSSCAYFYWALLLSSPTTGTLYCGAFRYCCAGGQVYAYMARQRAGGHFHYTTLRLLVVVGSMHDWRAACVGQDAGHSA